MSGPYFNKVGFEKYETMKRSARDATAEELNEIFRNATVEAGLVAENARLRAAAGNAASILSRHLSHQLSHQDSYTELRTARDGLVAALGDQQGTQPTESK